MNKLDAYQLAHAFVFKFRVPSALRKEAEKEVVEVIVRTANRVSEWSK